VHEQDRPTSTKKRQKTEGINSHICQR